MQGIQKSIDELSNSIDNMLATIRDLMAENAILWEVANAAGEVYVDQYDMGPVPFSTITAVKKMQKALVRLDDLK